MGYNEDEMDFRRGGMRDGGNYDYGPTIQTPLTEEQKLEAKRKREREQDLRDIAKGEAAIRLWNYLHTPSNYPKVYPEEEDD